MMRQIVLDTETTGLSVDQGHRIIEIACVELINRKLTGRQFHYYLNPERSIEVGALHVHGITNDFLKNKPLFSHICDEFLAFIKDAELIIHNAPFDVGFINYEFALIQHTCKSIADYCTITDTLSLAKKIHVGQRNNLDVLCKRYMIDNSKRDLHGALLDADLLAKVYLAMTGGQATLALFNEAKTHNLPQQITSIFSPDTTREPLKVIKATPEEEAENMKYLKMMQDKGKCVWLEA